MIYVLLNLNLIPFKKISKIFLITFQSNFRNSKYINAIEQLMEYNDRK